MKGRRTGHLSTMTRLLPPVFGTAAAQVAADKCPVDELPDEIDAGGLRCLDLTELIEACSVLLVNPQKRPGYRTPPAQSQGRWFSPIKHPEMVGGIDAALFSTRLAHAQPRG
jgi:hypothetical protein